MPFIIYQGLYCYKVMPFGLKNLGVTYQQLVNKVSEDLIKKNTEVYVNDVIITSTTYEGHHTNLHETFLVLSKYGMKLDPKKCFFS